MLGSKGLLHCAGLRVQTQPKPSDFLGEKILSMPSFGGKVKPLVPYHSFVARKNTLTISVEVMIVG
jgi:hypothetical protein